MPTSNLQPPTSNQYGLIGFPLDHSFSPTYFREKFLREGIDAVYEAFPLEDINALNALLKDHLRLRGLNVTTPYKQAVIPYLSSISEDAAAIGAVNCIAIEGGSLNGYNTDWTGYRDSLMPLLQSQHRKALVLGSGGASRAICYALRQLGIDFRIVSRSEAPGKLTYAAISPAFMEEYLLIINTTTLGTLGEGIPALPYNALGPGHLLYDLVYNPPTTPFLRQGEQKGAAVKNGMEMLRLQAEASWAIWNNP